MSEHTVWEMPEEEEKTREERGQKRDEKEQRGNEKGALAKK